MESCVDHRIGQFVLDIIQPAQGTGHKGPVAFACLAHTERDGFLIGILGSDKEFYAVHVLHAGKFKNHVFFSYFNFFGKSIHGIDFSDKNISKKPRVTRAFKDK